jgi:Na+/H+-dicarboxylate symporter
VFSIGFGIVLGQLGEPGRPLVQFFSAFEQVIMRLVSTIMWFSPVGIASLIAGKILELEDVGGTVQSLALVRSPNQTKKKKKQH